MIDWPFEREAMVTLLQRRPAVRQQKIEFSKPSFHRWFGYPPAQQARTRIPSGVNRQALPPTFGETRDSLIYGHSHAEAGFDPEAPVFARNGLSAYNLAIPGAGILHARKQAEYLHQAGIMPRVVIIGVEFLDFLEVHQAPGGCRPALEVWGYHRADKFI